MARRLTPTYHLVEQLLTYTSKLSVQGSGSNLVAFSGGVDSSLAAALVHQVSSNHETRNARAVLGISPAVPSHQIELAREVAESIGIPLVEVRTEEGMSEEYVSNTGDACYACKTALYSALEAVTNYVDGEMAGDGDGYVLFNGTNKDDLKDQTRVGLIAAENFNVASPLRHVTKDEVREAAKYLGLPNWNHAASPCLRSRLAFGVEATQSHLKLIEDSENLVRQALGWKNEVTKNMRVRMLSKSRAVIEIDSGEDLEVSRGKIEEFGIPETLRRIGFKGGLAEVRHFKSGSIAAVSSTRSYQDESIIHIETVSGVTDRNDRIVA